MPRGKKELAEQIIPYAASVEVEVGRLIHPRLPHNSPNPTATHPFRPRIHASPLCRQTSS